MHGNISNPAKVLEMQTGNFSNISMVCGIVNIGCF